MQYALTITCHRNYAIPTKHNCVILYLYLLAFWVADQKAIGDAPASAMTEKRLIMS